MFGLVSDFLWINYGSRVRLHFASTYEKPRQNRRLRRVTSFMWHYDLTVIENMWEVYLEQEGGPQR